jgi:hypothetical protein
MRIVPIILEPCDWLSSPFKEFMALPKDGQPISGWTNQNLAFLNVVTELRRLLAAPEEARRQSPGVAGLPQAGPQRRPRIKQDFDAIQRAEFADRAFAVIQDYFRASCTELTQVDDTLRAKFEAMDPAAFTCTVVNRSRVNGGEAHITVRNSKGRRMGFGDISYVNERHAEGNSSNGSISVAHDDYNLFLTMDHFGGMGRDKGKITPEQAAETLWTEFVKRAGIDYD